MKTNYYTYVVKALALAFLTILYPQWVSLPEAQSNLRAYGEMCAAEVAPIPTFSCGDGEIVPITVNGSIPANYTKDMTCDRPALLNNGAGSDGQCVPYSRLLNLSTPTMQAVAMCRQKKIRTADSMLFDEIDIIAHNPSTGATCWFQAVGEDGKPVDGSIVPSPNSIEATDFFAAPSDVVEDGCGKCHDNDPFMFSPFIGQL